MLPLLDTQVRLETLLFDGAARFPSLPGQESTSFSTRHVRPEVRLAARYQALPWLQLKAAYGNYDQAPDPRALFGPAGNSQLLPEGAQHVVAGLELRLRRSQPATTDNSAPRILYALSV